MEDLDEQGLVLTVEDSKIALNYFEGRITVEEYTAYMETRNKTFASNRAENSSETLPGALDIADNESEMDFDGDSSVMSAKDERMPRSRLPKDLQGLVGEANLKFARGEYQEAITMCNEVIRLAPNAHEPYQTLSVVYEEFGDMEKSLQCGLLGVYLSPKCVEEWLRLAEMAVEMNNLKQAAICYRNFVKYDRSNINIMWTSVKLDQQIGEPRRAAETLKKMFDTVQAQTDGAFSFQVSRELAKTYHGINQTSLGIACLEKAIDRHPDAFTSEDVNLLAELYIASKMFHQVITLLSRHCAVVFDPHDSDSGSGEAGPAEERATCTVPPALPIDLRTKLLVSFIYVKLPVLAQSLLGPLMEESPADMGDLYLDIAEAFLENGNYSAARPLLEKLVSSTQYNMAGVWLHYAECTSALGDLATAVKAYRNVVELVPSYVDARVSLSHLLQRMGLPSEALEALRAFSANAVASKSKYAGQESRLLFHTCLLLHSQQRYDEYIEAARYLLFGQFPEDFLSKNAFVLITTRPKHYFKLLVEKYGSEGYQRLTKPPAQSGASPLSVDEMWDLYMQACRTLDAQKDYAKLMEFSLYALSSAKFASDEEKCKEACFMCLVSQILMRNGRTVFYLVRDMVKKDFDNCQVQNVLSVGVEFARNDANHMKFIERQLQRHPESFCLQVATGNCATMSGSYRTALGHYMQAYGKLSDSPLLNLLVGVNFVHMASQLFATNRTTSVVQACAFLQRYAELRGHSQEAYYNLGRAMHQLSLYHAAVHYYERALAIGAPAVTGSDDGDLHMFDLSKETAFNLALIYRSNGSDALAQELYQRYCVI